MTPGPSHEAGAVERVGAATAVDVGLAQLGFGPRDCRSGTNAGWRRWGGIDADRDTARRRGVGAAALADRAGRREFRLCRRDLRLASLVEERLAEVRLSLCIRGLHG